MNRRPTARGRTRCSVCVSCVVTQKCSYVCSFFLCLSNNAALALSFVPALHVTTYFFLVLSNSRTRTVGARSRSSVLVAALNQGRVAPRDSCAHTALTLRSDLLRRSGDSP